MAKPTSLEPNGDSVTESLRKRNTPIRANTQEDARRTVLELNALEENEAKEEKDRKTFGRTPDGTVFTVPYTHDMVSQLLSPSEPKNLSDISVLFIMFLHILLAWALPSTVKKPVLAAIFLF